MRALYVAIGLSVLYCILICFLLPGVDLAALFLASLCRWMITIWLIQNLAQGRNWARLVFGILFVISIPYFIIYAPRLYRDSKVLGLLDVVVWLLHLFAVVTLFSSPAKLWFVRAPATPPAENSTSNPESQ